MNKLATVNVQGGEYATVPTRLKAFRQSHPRASVETSPTITESGEIIFKATIVMDRNDPSSATATGHSFGKNTGAKAFEKLETVSVGRALSLLGYLNNGQIASTEEMEEFEAYKFDKFKDDIEEAQSVEELMDIFNRMNGEEKKTFTTLLASRKKELLNG